MDNDGVMKNSEISWLSRRHLRRYRARPSRHRTDTFFSVHQINVMPNKLILPGLVDSSLKSNRKARRRPSMGQSHPSRPADNGFDPTSLQFSIGAHLIVIRSARPVGLPPRKAALLSLTPRPYRGLPPHIPVHRQTLSCAPISALCRATKGIMIPHPWHIRNPGVAADHAPTRSISHHPTRPPRPPPTACTIRAEISTFHTTRSTAPTPLRPARSSSASNWAWAMISTSRLARRCAWAQEGKRCLCHRKLCERFRKPKRTWTTGWPGKRAERGAWEWVCSRRVGSLVEMWRRVLYVDCQAVLLREWQDMRQEWAATETRRLEDEVGVESRLSLAHPLPQ